MQLKDFWLNTKLECNHGPCAARDEGYVLTHVFVSDYPSYIMTEMIITVMTAKWCSWLSNDLLDSVWRFLNVLGRCAIIFYESYTDNEYTNFEDFVYYILC